MAESAQKTLYMMRPSNGPVFIVYDRGLAEWLLSKVNAKFNQAIKLEIHERKETDHRRTSD